MTPPSTRNGKASLSAYLPLEDYSWLKSQAKANYRSISGQIQAMIHQQRMESENEKVLEVTQKGASAQEVG